LFGPVFEKADSSFSAVGIQALREACRDRHAANPPVPILALGGVSVKNAKLCLNAGAAGVAGIRLFQQGNLSETVSRLRALAKSASK
jgi:thiamine-phosphate pyrophosphorylase